jgi:ABC-type dipeptide/oligopeptide/nickel transport system permease subunit
MKRLSLAAQARLALPVLGIWTLLGVAGWLTRGGPALLLGLGNDFAALLAVLVLALALGLPLGALAGSGPRWIDTTLGFTTDWIGAVPVVLLLTFVRPGGATFGTSLLWLGLLRSLEVGWVVRSALLRAAALDPTWAARSLGYIPLSVFLNERLKAAARPALAHLAFTPVWTFLLDSVASAAGLGAASSEHSLGALVARPGSSPVTNVAAIVAVVSLTWALHVLSQLYSLRLARK